MSEKNVYSEFPTEGPVIVTHDGRPIHVRMDNPNDAFAFLLRWQGQSVDYALRYGGYKVVQVPADRWSELEMRHHYGPNAFRHDHPQQIYPASDRALVRENCCACCLEGYDSERERFRPLNPNGPNVSNWQRDYVQARRPIPAEWRNAFYSYKDDDNEPWKKALELDIASYGVTFTN